MGIKHLSGAGINAGLRPLFYVYVTSFFTISLFEIFNKSIYFIPIHILIIPNFTSQLRRIPMNVLVIGGTGTVGSQVVKLLSAKGANVKVTSQSTEKINQLPDGVSGVLANLEDKNTLQPAFEGMENVFLLNAVSMTETAQGLAAVEAAKSAGIKRIIYLSVHNLYDGLHIPHFKTKVPIENAIKESGIAYTILAPNNYYQNDYWFKQAIMEYGVYPQPVGDVGLNRVDVRDIAEAAVNAFFEPGHDGKTYPLVGPDVHTGNDIAAIFSKHLDKEIHYGGNDLEAWGEQSKQFLPEWMIHDFKIMYQHFQDHGFIASDEDYIQQKRILKKDPRSFDAFVGELAGDWKS